MANKFLSSGGSIIPEKQLAGRIVCSNKGGKVTGSIIRIGSEERMVVEGR